MAIATIPFEKMHGLGNDFVFVAAGDIMKLPDGEAFLKSWHDRLPELARALCDRRFGVGADGLILIVNIRQPQEREIVAHYPDVDRAQVGWTYTNSDGSPSKMCGNGLRCAALFAVNHNLVDGNRFAIATEVGAIAVDFETDESITVDLGAPVLTPSLIPVADQERDRFVDERLPGLNLKATCVSMGNPHCVVFLDQAAGEEGVLFPEQHLQMAKAVQSLPFFPQGVNVEFASVENREKVRVSVLERGSGPTLACASGAAATLVAGVLEGRLNRRASVYLPGGALTVDWSENDGRVRLTGPARRAYRGAIDLAALSLKGQRSDAVSDSCSLSNPRQARSARSHESHQSPQSLPLRSSKEKTEVVL